MNESEKKSRRADRAHDRGVRLEALVELVRERMGFEGPHLHGCAAPLSDAPKLIYRDYFTRSKIGLRFQILSFALTLFRAFDFVCQFARSPFFGPFARFPAGKRFFFYRATG